MDVFDDSEIMAHSKCSFDKNAEMLLQPILLTNVCFGFGNIFMFWGAIWGVSNNPLSIKTN